MPWELEVDGGAVEGGVEDDSTEVTALSPDSPPTPTTADFAETSTPAELEFTAVPDTQEVELEPLWKNKTDSS